MSDGEIVKKKKNFPLKKILFRISSALFFYLSQTFRCLSSLSCLYRQQLYAETTLELNK